MEFFELVLEAFELVFSVAFGAADVAVSGHVLGNADVVFFEPMTDDA